MKKFIAVLLTLILALSLCACGNDEVSNTDNSNEVNKYVGTWVCNLEESPYFHYSDIYSIRLLPNGKAIWNRGDYQDDHTLVIDESLVNAGEWILDEDRIIVFHSPYDGETWAMILNVVSDEKLSYSEFVYTKTN